jgi:hypothetical protein
MRNDLVLEVRIHGPVHVVVTSETGVEALDNGHEKPEEEVGELGCLVSAVA